MRIDNERKHQRIRDGQDNVTRFEVFQDVVLGRNAGDAISPESQMFNRNLKSVFYAAIIVIVADLFWMILDITRGGSLRLSSGIGLAAIIIQMVSSAYMLVLRKINKDRKLVKYSFLCYYIILICTVCALVVTKNSVMLEGDKTPITGIPLSTFYLFILMLIPLPSRRDSIILGIIYVIFWTLPLFLPGKEMCPLTQQVVLGICMIIAYWGMRKVNLALAESMQRLSVLSFTDPLTGVLNRRALESYWENICLGKNTETIGILFFDIDDFKKYNDSYSHSRGDDVLNLVCDIIVKEIEHEHDFLFRYGGEEFVVVLRNRSAEETIAYAKRLREAIYNAFIPRDDGSNYDRITITVGCDCEKIEDKSSSNYIIKADQQLYVGKSHGKNCVAFDGEIYR